MSAEELWQSVERTAHRLLRNKRKILPIFLNVELRDRLAVESDFTRERIIESLDELNTKPYKSMRRRAGQSNHAYTVLFPHPLAPTRATYVPGFTEILRPRRTRTPGRVGYRK